MNAALIIPARNEEECIAAVVEEARRFFPGPIVVVDNGSSDATATEAAVAGARVVVEPQAGYGGACMAGAEAVPGCETLVFMDGDGSDCPEDIAPLLAAIEAGADVALGVRRGPGVEPGSMTLAARFGNWLSGALIGLWTGRRPRDLSPLKAVSRDALLRIAPRELTYGWTVELIATAASRGMTIAEVETGYRRRKGGRSKVSGTVSGSARAAWRILATLARVALIQSPVTVVGGAGGVVAGLAVLAAFTLWLFVQGPSSPALLVSSWLLAWPLLLVAIAAGTGLTALVRRTKAVRR